MLITAPWPRLHAERLDPAIETQFELFHAALSAIREIRSRQNIAPRQPVSCCIACDPQSARLLEPLTGHFQSLAQARMVALGESVSPPRTNATLQRAQLQVYVDLEGLIDVEAEIVRLEKQQERLTASIAGKEKKLTNQNFVDRAPAEVVQREREGLQQLQEQLQTVVGSLAALRGAAS
jgi:valyl-tRNA synthetase